MTIAGIALPVLDNGSAVSVQPSPPLQDDGLNSTQGPSSSGSNGRNRRQLSIAVPDNSGSQAYTVLEEGEATATATASTSTAPVTVTSSISAMDASNEQEQQQQEQRAIAMQSLEGKGAQSTKTDIDPGSHSRADSGTSSASMASTEGGNRLSDFTALSEQRSSLASTAQTSEAGHPSPRDPTAAQPDLPASNSACSDVDTSPIVQVTGPRSPAFGTYETRATGTVAPQQQSIQGTAGEPESRLSPASSAHGPIISTSISAGPNRRSFFASLLSRSSSFNGHSPSNSLSARSVSQQGLGHAAIPSQRTFPHSPSRASTSSSPVGTDAPRRSHSIQGRNGSHARHSSNPVPPSPTMLSSTPASVPAAARTPIASRRSMSPAVSVPAPHDGVFGTQNSGTAFSDLQPAFTASTATTSAGPTSNSRASRILRQFSGAERPSSDRGVRSPTPTAGLSRSSTSNALLAASEPSAEVPKAPPSLESIGLSLNPLSPTLPVSKHGQPLCGAVLDGKYLLIGTTVGLDFLPLHRAGNRPLRSGLFSKFSSSTSSPVLGMSTSGSNPFLSSSVSSADPPSSPKEYSRDVRTRKPIPLIKKTRFKQLAVLGERSNVLLAVAGRNDHVRVYALDSLRAIIEKKIREIDEKERAPALSSSIGSSGVQGLGFTSPGKGLGVFLPGSSQARVPPVPPVPSGYKGKERAGIAPISSAPQSPSRASSSPRIPSSSTMSSIASTSSAGAVSMIEAPERSPPPAYAFPNVSPTTSRPHSPTSRRAGQSRSNPSSGGGNTYARRRSSASGSSGPPTPRYARNRSRSNLQNSSVSPLPSPPGSSGGPSAALRKYKSRDSLRRPSSAGHGSSSNVVGTFSRRGSAATVTPGTVAALAAADLGLPAPSARRRSSASNEARSRRSSAAASATLEEDYEWVDAPESPVVSLANGLNHEEIAEEADLSFPEHPVVASGRTRGRTASSSTKLEARAATARSTDDSNDASIMQEEPEPTALSPQMESTAVAPARKQVNRRLSLAQILQEDPEEESVAGQPARPSVGMTRSSSSGVLSTRSGSTLRSSNTIGQPRAAVTRGGRDEFASLSDFLRAGPPSPRGAPLSRSSSGGIAPAIASKPKMLARAAVITPVLGTDDEDGSGPSFLDIMRAGPPASAPGMTASSSSSSTSNNSEGAARRPSVPRKLSKSSKASLSRRPSKVDLAKELSSPQMARSPIMLQTEAATVLAAIDTDVAEQTATADAEQPHTRSAASSPIRERTTSLHSSHQASGRQRVASENLLPASQNALASARMHKRRSYQPRSPTFTRVQHSAPAEGEPASGGSNGMSLQDILSMDPPPSANQPLSESPERSSTMSRTDTRESNASSAATATADPTTPGARNKRKRWSLLDGLRAPSPISPNSGAAASSGMQLSRSSTSLASSSAAPSPNPAMNGYVSSSSLASSASRASTDGRSSVLSQVPEHQVAPPTVNGALNNAPPAIPLLKARPGNPLEDESPPFGNLTSELGNAASLAAAAAQGANNPDGTTVTFTQSRTVISGPNGPASDGYDRDASGRTAAQQAALTGNLEYVKLARTKGARFVRASETAKRTYLAVLCGEQGERIELFTGSKNVSLSLNRTFVLPETPRTIEFQLQGEDLLDLYLIYDSAIFALEPSTVRVREVGIQRNERRAARRERERLQREAAVLETAGTSLLPHSSSPQPSDAAGTDNAISLPLDEESAAMARQSSQDELPPPPLTPLGANMPVPVPSTSEDTSEPVRSSAPIPDTFDAATSAAMVSDPSAEGESRPSRARAASDEADRAADAAAATAGPVVPYTTFQQLEYLPPVPPSVLSSSYIIPPTYETVLSASPAPMQGEGTLGLVSPDVRAVSSMPSPLDSRGPFSTTDSTTGTPLLSPVSLLSNPSAKNTGPPGLFFVSKGRTNTGIVDGDGRSVVKKPVSWLTPDYEPCAAEQAAGLETFTRLDVLLTSNKSKVCLAAFGPASARVIELGGPYELSAEVVPPEAYKRRLKSANSVAAAAASGREVGPDEVFIRDVTYLAKSGEATYFAERVGSGIMIHSLGAIGFSVPS